MSASVKAVLEILAKAQTGSAVKKVREIDAQLKRSDRRDAK